MEFDATNVNISYMDHVTILGYTDEPNNIRLTVCVMKNYINKNNYINITKIYPYLVNNFRSWKKRTTGREYMNNLSINTGIQQSELTETVRRCRRNIDIHGLYVHHVIIFDVIIDFILDENIRSILLELLSWYMFSDIYGTKHNNDNTITLNKNLISISELGIIKILDKYEEVYRVSKGKECGICFELVYSKPLENDRYFGVLDACDHTFCIKCINTWTMSRRSNNEEINCPICRTRFRSIISSKFYTRVN
ncbi:zinc finger-like protein [Volepox virus]|uniref:Zinc finger-like protein n=1 Tax=Volepox virus TaxID=28874 RepID=A0A1C9KC24_9POXV|nr:zinc finger-like protein [Volepox virus]AOP31704.1 zinc finger-like protein [Volepox virus]